MLKLTADFVVPKSKPRSGIVDIFLSWVLERVAMLNVVKTLIGSEGRAEEDLNMEEDGKVAEQNKRILKQMKSRSVMQ